MPRGAVLFRKWTILTHRYLGIAVCLLFVVWFASGIAIIYGRGMPRLTPEVRLARLPVLNLDSARLTPEEAAARADLLDPPLQAILVTVMDRPAYRFLSEGGARLTVFADTGEILERLDRDQALLIAQRFLNVSSATLQYAGPLTRADQWTLLEGAMLMPMHKVAAGDGLGTEIYVSERTGEVAVHTTRGSRALAWAGAIPHWLYFAALRRNGAAWRQVVLWASGIGTVVALVGIFVGLLRFSPSSRYRFMQARSSIPYAGWNRWHYITGVFFGLFSLTWVFSGLLSMDPWWWSPDRSPGSGERWAFSGGGLEMSLFPLPAGTAWRGVLAEREVKELEFMRVQGQPYFLARSAQARPVLMAVNPPGRVRDPFSTESLLARAGEAFPGQPVVESGTLSAYDDYYYSRDGSLPLPVLRVKFDDAQRTWYYIDPATGRIVQRVEKRNRLERWIYNGLHSLDFSFWYGRRPLWDIGVITLCLGGLLLSILGVMLGTRRLRRRARGFFRPRLGLSGAEDARAARRGSAAP
jgi:hypothetical protein